MEYCGVINSDAYEHAGRDMNSEGIIGKVSSA